MLNLTPGPDMLYVIGRSLSDGKSAGLVSALGIGTGTLVHVALVALGLASVLQTVPIAFHLVKFAGATYLVFLGIRTLVDSAALSGGAHHPLPEPLWTVFRQSMLTNILNPKVALFFLAFLPQFVSSRQEGTWKQVVFLGFVFDTSGTLVNAGIAHTAGRLQRLNARGIRATSVFKRTTGLLFIGIGVRLAMLKRS